MRLLDRYLLRELLLPLSYCLSGFLIFWISFDLISNLDDYQKNQLQVADVVHYYIVRLPELLVFILPIVLLLALLYALSNHARHHEIIAMRAAGQSLWRIGLPYFGLGLVLSGFVFYLNEFWVPGGAEAADHILNGHTSHQDTQVRRNLNFKNDSDNRIWMIGSYDPRTAEMTRVSIDWTLPDGARRRIIAESGEWTNGSWTFHNVTQWDYPAGPGLILPPTSSTNLVAAGFSETPALIKSEIKVSNLNSLQAAKRPQLSIGEIRDYLHLHRRLSDIDAARLHTQLHGRLAEPWTCLVVVLIALPFGAAAARRNVFVGVANSIFICFGYFILLKLGLALGTGGYLPGWFAAWMPNVCFAGLGIWMTYQVR